MKRKGSMEKKIQVHMSYRENVSMIW